MAFTDYIFDPGVSQNIFLPVNGTENIFIATLKANLSGNITSALEPCYGKYGISWKWSTFESSPSGVGLLSSVQTVYPSAWNTMQCTLSSGSLTPGQPGTYPKKWTSESPLSAELFNPTLFTLCSGESVTWTLSTTNWTYSQVIPLSVSPFFNFSLKYEDFGKDNFTTDFNTNTKLTLNARTEIDCINTCWTWKERKSANSITLVTWKKTKCNEIFAKKWENDSSSTPREKTIINEVFDFNVIAPPLIKLYTPNRYVLSGTEVKFQNLIENIESVDSIVIDFDDGKTLYLSGDDLTKTHFTTSYEVLGYKTIKVTTYTPYGAEAYFEEVFPNIVEVLAEYDTVSPSEYRLTTTTLELPWKSQPTVGSNDWAVEDNINSCFRKFDENLNYLNSRSKIYTNTYSDYFGYLGPLPTVTGNLTANPIWTWEDADCLNTSLEYDITWRKLLSAESSVDTGEFVSYGTWEDQICEFNFINTGCTERKSLTSTDCLQWNWKSRKSLNTNEIVSWKQTKTGGDYSKWWAYQPCPEGKYIVCDEGLWHVNIPKLNDYYFEIAVPRVQPRCIYQAIVSRDNNLFLAQKTQIRLLSSDYEAFYYDNRSTYDGVLDFSNLESIRLDSEGKIFVVDSILSQVAVYIYNPEGLGNSWRLLVNWGGVGTGNYKFLNPIDLHIDRLDNVWVVDAGNYQVKHYSNTGTWLKTIKDDVFKEDSVLSVCVDSQDQVHVLTNNQIRVYSYNGEFLFSYEFSDLVSEKSPRRINTSYNREMVYLALDKQVLRFFRNGIFSGYIIQEKKEVYNIRDIYQDEYRNLLITTNDKILKYGDIMTQTLMKGDLPVAYWSLNDILIHKEEYIQNWVYTKSFQRMWDNIEMFRRSLFFEQEGCKAYKGPVYGKDKMIIGQNEIVTSTVVNRILQYLWINFSTMIDYFDPNCKD